MKVIYSLLAVTLIVSLIGCGSSEPSAAHTSSQDSPTGDHEHDESEHPQSFSEAVEQIKERGSRITDAFASGEPDSAHDDLHGIGHVIESLPELAKKAGLSAEEQDTVQQVTEALMDAFGELDGTLHGGEAVEVEEVSKNISAQIEKLESML
jgi:hypothetical protein